MELSDERKREIRAEEEAKLRAEEQYRDQVRQELHAQQQTEIEQQYREEVQAELADDSGPDSPFATVSPPQPPSSTPVAHRRTGSRLVSRVMAAVLILGGIVCAGLAFSKGFTLPFTGSRSEIVLRAEAPDEFEVVDAEAVIGEESGSKPDSSRSATPIHSTVSKPAVTTNRAALKGTGISIEVPSGWKLEPSDFDDVLEIRWQGAGVASGREEVVAYLLLQKLELRPDEDLDDFAERLLEMFLNSTTPDQSIDLQEEREIENFHGVKALSIDVVAKGFMPYHMRNPYFTKNGYGCILTCYATAGSFEERSPAFQRMLDSVRL